MTDDEDRSDEGGDSACFLHLVCPECGVVTGDQEHQPGCTYVLTESTLDPVDPDEPSRDDRGR